MKNKAFTLAEVLITLGIIGIVAAMTLPTVITKYQKQETVTRLKKVYSLLQQATISAKQDYGEVDDWDYSNAYEFGQKYFKPYLKVMIDDKAKLYQWTDLTGHLVSNSARPTLILADGTYIFIYFPNVYPVNFHIAVDLNGQKKPNKLGRDLFIFTYHNNGLRTYSQYNFRLSRHDMIMPEGTSGQCNIHASGGVFGVGSYCSAVVEYDGWEIKDDYPW